MAQLLIVDDAPVLLSTLAEVVAEAGHVVDTSPTGPEALGKALECDYDAIILDVQLPELSGWQVLNELRRHKKTPVIIVTASNEPEDCVQGLNAGADDYLVKPFVLDELLARIRALIRRTTDNSLPSVRVDDVAIDLGTRHVLRAGLAVPLTAGEFQLLALLARHRGRTFSRAQLYRRLYRECSASTSNVLEVHIYHLRQKLGRRLIVTRRGLGYVLPG